MYPISHLIAPPQLELVGPNDTVLVTGTGSNISVTLGPLLTSKGGQQYYCKATVAIESLGLSLSSESAPYTVTVQSKSSCAADCPHTLPTQQS